MGRGSRIIIFVDEAPKSAQEMNRVMYLALTALPLQVLLIMKF